MGKAKKNPVAAATANRADRNVEFDRSDILYPKQSTGENPAVIILAERLGLTITHARIVCHLAGIGGRHG